MLSTENPPPDPCEISQLKCVSSDERNCGDSQRQFEVDLFKSGLDDTTHPLPNFSIRDYVFNTRGKDIKNNWPFSQKNLQLCLKHGVNDVLPPFQSLDSVRNQSIVDCAVENLRDSDVTRLDELSDNCLRGKLTVDVEKINSSASEVDKEFPSTTTSQSYSGVTSVPAIRTHPCLQPEGVQLPVSRAKNPDFENRVSNKVEISIQSSVKKCRLVLKQNNFAEPKLIVDLAANTALVSETMASKVCPVCKTFTSSSNTTLNAHIDQCLSGGSSIKWTANSKVIKHRIKPRKMRLMVDIYQTALHYTLEDLDKRNGTNWASNLGPSAQDSEASAEEEKKTYYSVNTEDIDQEGAVYIDSTGTKLRILSKFNDPPSKSNATDDARPDFVKRDGGRKILSSKKKKYVIQKHKLRKNSLDGQGSCSPISDHLLECPPHGSNSCYHGLEADNRQPKLFHSEGSKEDDPARPLPSHQKKDGNFGRITKWVGSKRTGLKKKINLDHENRHPDRSMKNLRVMSASLLGDALSNENMPTISPSSSDEDPHLSTRSHKRKENLVYNSQDGPVGPPCQRKSPAFPLLKSQHSDGEKDHLMFSKLNVKQSNVPLVHECHLDPRNDTENNVSSHCDKKIGTESKPDMKSNGSFVVSSMSKHHTTSSEGKKSSSLCKSPLNHTISSGSKKFSSLRKKLLSVSHASVTESKKNLGRKVSNFKNPRLQCTSQSDEEEVVGSRLVYHGQNNLVETPRGNATRLEKYVGMPLINRTRVLKIRKKMGGIRNSGEGDMTFQGLVASPESDSHSVGKNFDSFTVGNIPADASNFLEEEAGMPDDFVSGPTYGMTDGEAFASFSRSLGSVLPGLAESSNVECGSHYYNGHDLVNPDSHGVAERDADEGQGNYFIDVDPIPIPGPPGSFLPSPGRMGSVELQGHSSLTSCRIQTSEDGHEVVDKDSSDSPISAISEVSKSVAARSISISIANTSPQSQFRHKTQCDVSEDRSCPAVEGSSFEQVASGDRLLNLVQPDVILSEVIHKIQNIQPCCCSRKDGFLNYQESQTFRRRSMASPVLGQENQMNDDRKSEIHHPDFGSGRDSEKEPTPEPEKCAAISPMGFAPTLLPHSSETAFSACESPSTPNPVLRLMGKNLMVLSKDDNPSPQIRPTQSNMAIDHPGWRSTETGPSAGNYQNELNSFPHNLSRSPSSFCKLQPQLPTQHFDFNSLDSLRVPSNHGPALLSTQPSEAMFPSTSFGGNVASKCHGYASEFNLVAGQLGSNIRLDSRTIHDAQKVVTPVCHLKAADSIGVKQKELIVIDDTLESEASLSAHPPFSYQTRVHPRFTGSPTVVCRNTMVPPSKGMTGNLGKWNCIAEGSSVLHSNPSTASLPSNVHLRPSVYFSPGFS